MYIDLAGKWKLSLSAEDGVQSGAVLLPGILQAQGYGNPIGIHTPWVSSLHDDFWYEQKEFQYAQEDGVKVPFLSQPPRHFTGEAFYRRTFVITETLAENWYFFAELAKWRSHVWVDGEEKGGDCSLCTPHEVCLGTLTAGTHELLVCLDNSMQYPYRPDGHGVSDALGASWNGMAGEIALYSEKERSARLAEKKRYAETHKRTVEIRDGKFWVDGHIVYFRATHFGGEFPLSGYPETDAAWWRSKMRILKEYGLNGIRFHSFCPPEAAFAAADQENIFLLVECGMWNHFDRNPAGEDMLAVLNRESQRIVASFGHHPSFVFFSSGNEPSGQWYGPLKQWVGEIREYDAKLGYAGRRVYTAQSGWFYDTEPSEITGTDFIYFHRSASGPFPGGVIRNFRGWRGKDYSPSLSGCRLPVVSHELGQWCSYPDFSVIDKFTGYLQPGNFEVFRESARAAGLLGQNERFVRCSGENQLRLYKEDLEATLRTPQIEGFELLDLHDYLGQGTALVGFLDAFWEKKTGIDPARFRCFCGQTVLLARCPSYVWRNTEQAVIGLEVCHYGQTALTGARVRWELWAEEKCLLNGELEPESILPGGNTAIGDISLSFTEIRRTADCRLRVSLQANKLSEPVVNEWQLYVIAQTDGQIPENVVYTKDWQTAKAALAQGKRVVYTPYLTSLDYECPSLSIKNVFWNSQLGPTWSRPLGLVVDRKHPIFSDFPTEESGGWQWEDILRHARGFRLTGLMEAAVPVRVIDDWNRNLPLALIFEARAGAGRLLVAAADLDGDFTQRPAAAALRSAVLSYAASDSFCPKGQITLQAVEEKLFPDLRMLRLSEGVSYEPAARVTDGDAVLQPNPNSYVRIEKERFPITLTVNLKKPVRVEGLLLVPVQRDRAHEGFIRQYEVLCKRTDGQTFCVEAEGSMPNSCNSYRIRFDEPVLTDQLKLVVYSAYGCVEKKRWMDTADGWQKKWLKASAVVQLACIHVLCAEPAGDSDVLFWEKDQNTNTKEIEA